MSAENSRDSSGSTTPDEAALRQLMDRIRLMHREFEELLFLKHAVEMLKDFRKRLVQERWD